MSERSLAARPVDQLAGSAWRDLAVGHVRRLARGQEPVEGLADRADVATRDQNPGDVGTTRGTLLDEGEDLVGFDRIAEGGEALDDPVNARRSLLPELLEEVAEPRGLVIDEVAEDVDLAPRPLGVDLDAGDDLENGVDPGGGSGRLDRLRRVVVGDGEDADAAADGLLDERVGGERPVRGRRVRVEIDPAHPLPRGVRTLRPRRQRRQERVGVAIHDGDRRVSRWRRPSDVTRGRRRRGRRRGASALRTPPRPSRRRAGPCP